MRTSHKLARRGKLTDEQRKELVQAIESAGGMTRLVCSKEVLEAVASLFETSTPLLLDPGSDDSQFWKVLINFEAAARKDLGHPPLSL
jgi:hypothetical protein